MPHDPTPQEARLTTALDTIAPAPAPTAQPLQDERTRIAAHLMERQASISPRYLYDALGCHLFDAITELDEYYPTRTERAIAEQHRVPIAGFLTDHAGPQAPLVDLGAGSCSKAPFSFGPLGCTEYVAVDLARDHVERALLGLRTRHPGVRMQCVALDLVWHLPKLASHVARPAVLFYPGSSIGNFEPEQALRLLREMHAVARGGALLIGVDLWKSPAELQAAYDDATGVTAAFNRNVLRHVNRLIGADFDPRQWQHIAHVDSERQRVEMRLAAIGAQTVHWPGGERRFADAEYIHTENSYKWTRDGFADCLQQAGWQAPRSWTDDHARFALFAAAA